MDPPRKEQPHYFTTKHADDSPHKTHKSFKSDRRDKPKHSGKAGALAFGKKGGAGGKTTWGRPGDEMKVTQEEEEMGATNPSDPNFDPDYEASGALPPQHRWDWEPSSQAHLKFASSLEDFAKFKQRMREAAREYVQSNDVSEFCRILDSQGMSVYHQDLPAILLKLSLDLSDEERVRIHNLLAALYKRDLITQTQMGAGVRKLYNVLDDLRVDYPRANVKLREFLQFAVAGGLMPASVADQLEQEQQALSDTEKVAQLKKSMDDIILEYLSSEELEDAAASLKELNAPHLHFEFVKRLIRHSLDQGHRQREGASLFLSEQCGSSGALSLESVEKGFTVLLERVEDIQLDVPSCLKLLSVFIARAVVDEVLAPAFLVRVDLDVNDAGSQVLRQAQQLLKQENASEHLLYAWEDMEEQEREGREKRQAAGNAATNMESKAQ